MPLNRISEFRGLAKKQNSTEKTWFYYGVGTRPWLVGYVWENEFHRQFVGVIDCKDVKIYEGDVLSDGRTIIGVVLFVNSVFSVVNENKEAQFIHSSYTVIGNVDEHDYLRRRFQEIL
jgi:hypothetical protein